LHINPRSLGPSGPTIDFLLTPHRGKILTALSHRLYPSPRCGEKCPELSEVELNTEEIQRYRINTVRRSTKETILEHQEKMIKFYVANILEG
jgi:hypothetical protein